MSVSGVNYSLKSENLTGDLRLYYDFFTGNLRDSFSSGGLFYASFENLIDSGNLVGISNSITGASDSAAKLFCATNFSPNGQARLEESTISISGFSGLDCRRCSSIICFDNTGVLTDGVLLGSLEKIETVIDGNTITGYQGFNFGITKRGHLFFQYGTPNGLSVSTANSIELSKKNVVYFNIDGGFLDMGRFDFLNQKIQNSRHNILNEYVGFPSSCYIGGSNLYYSTSSGEQSSINSEIESILFFDSSVNTQSLFSVASGLIGDYYFQTGIVSEVAVITGSQLIPVYKTGVTGYFANQTGTKLIPTGVVVNRVLVPNIVFSGESEGYRYFKDYGDHVEEIGYLSPSLFGTYSPTGETAHATLGLQSGSYSGISYSVSEETEILFDEEPLYEYVPLTGVTSEISGYTIINLSGITTITGQPSSGVIIDEPADSFKKDLVYFMGEYV